MSFQGKKNVYVCQKCGARLVTIDADEGTTPFLTGCASAGCDGAAMSQMYRVDQGLTPTHEWRRPRGANYLDESTKDHVQRGGLLLYPISRKTLRQLNG